MNAIAVFLLFLVVVVTFVSGSNTPKMLRFGGLQTKTEEVGDLLSAAEMEQGDEKKDRFRRATCDLLSASTPWGSLNHSACAAHCLAMRKGFKGGRCKRGVCHCRK